MLKTLIVDDEKIVRAEIRRLAEWSRYGIEIVGEAENGRAALAFLRKNPVDLMITDLSMPGLSGMEFLEAVRKEFAELRIVVMTMHQNFDYIQQAMRLGVVDYITKTQIEKEHFGSILEKILNRLSPRPGTRQFQQDRARFLCRTEPNAVPSTKTQFLDDGIWLSDSGQTVSPEEGMVLLEVRGLKGLYYTDAAAFLREFLKRELFYTYHRGQQSYFCVYQTFEPNYAAREQLTAEFQGTEWILDDEWYQRILKKIPEMLFTRDELVVFLYQPFLKCASYQNLPVEEYFARTDSLHWWYQWKMWLEKLREDTSGYLQPEDSSGRVLQRAIQYLDSHYMQNIDLSAMLQMTAMSKSLFSASFKEATGKSFISYLKTIRIERAKTLLLETQHSIQDIALQVGYDDERYFRKIFIEIVGVSPAQFRKRHIFPVQN